MAEHTPNDERERAGGESETSRRERLAWAVVFSVPPGVGIAIATAQVSRGSITDPIVLTAFAVATLGLFALVYGATRVNAAPVTDGDDGRSRSSASTTNDGRAATDGSRTASQPSETTSGGADTTSGDADTTSSNDDTASSDAGASNPDA